jgi:hypothetical protein
MTNFAASRFPALATDQNKPSRLPHGLGLSLRLLPLPIGEIAVLLTAWLLVLHI